MNHEIANAFLSATIETFSTMCNISPTRSGPISLQKGIVPILDIYSMIGIMGPFKVTYVLTMNEPTALKMGSSFVGEPITEINEEVLDSLGEIVNIIGGAAAAKFCNGSISLSLPTVLFGKNLQHAAKSTFPWLIIPMKETSLGDFMIEILYET